MESEWSIIISLPIFFSNLKSKITYCQIKWKNTKVSKVKSHSPQPNPVFHIYPDICVDISWYVSFQTFLYKYTII